MLSATNKQLQSLLRVSAAMWGNDRILLETEEVG